MKTIKILIGVIVLIVGLADNVFATSCRLGADCIIRSYEDYIFMPTAGKGNYECRIKRKIIPGADLNFEGDYSITIRSHDYTAWWSHKDAHHAYVGRHDIIYFPPDEIFDKGYFKVSVWRPWTSVNPDHNEFKEVEITVNCIKTDSKN